MLDAVFALNPRAILSSISNVFTVKRKQLLVPCVTTKQYERAILSNICIVTQQEETLNAAIHTAQTLLRGPLSYGGISAIGTAKKPWNVIIPDVEESIQTPKLLMTTEGLSILGKDMSALIHSAATVQTKRVTWQAT
jgi:hypothetical protein